jgi:hypothetical protein
MINPYPILTTFKLTYPFGMHMQGRSFSSGSYRYGFNSQEQDNEIYGTGNSYTAEFWQYDSRLGRRWNVDPKPDVSISSYATFSNNPIYYVDQRGDTIRFAKGSGLVFKFLTIAKLTIAAIFSKDVRNDLVDLITDENVHTIHKYKSKEGDLKLGDYVIPNSKYENEPLGLPDPFWTDEQLSEFQKKYDENLKNNIKSSNCNTPQKKYSLKVDNKSLILNCKI